MNEILITLAILAALLLGYGFGRWHGAVKLNNFVKSLHASSGALEEAVKNNQPKETK